MTRTLTIRGTTITDDGPAYTIAEVGSNHQGDFPLAQRMVENAAKAGASAVKFQKRDNRTLFTAAAYDEPYNSPHAFGPTYGTHREALEFTLDQHHQLLQLAHRHEIAYICTAFDAPSLDGLLSIGVDAIKFASGDLLSLSLIETAFKAAVPVILSTGGWDAETVQRALQHLERLHQATGTDYAVLHCTAVYPCPYELAALPVIGWLQSLAPDTVIGYSGHELGWGVVPVAYALGARIIEKHFTIDRSWKGSDQHFSLTPSEFQAMGRALEQARHALAIATKQTHPSEASAMAKLSKSVYAAHALEAGAVLTAADMVIKAPMVAGAATANLMRLLEGGVLLQAKAVDEPLFERERGDSGDGIA